MIPDALSVFTTHDNDFACVCGAAYASRGPAVLCCGRRLLAGEEPGNTRCYSEP